MFMIVLLVIAVASAGFLVALLGAWKDPLWEQFSLRKLLRTPIITVLAGIFLAISLGSPTDFWEVSLYVLSAVALERLLVDYLYKTIQREMPSKFLRPQRDTRWLRERLSQVLKTRTKAVR